MDGATTLPVIRIVSGGQTGVDRGALDAAIFLQIPHGGWCPRGRMAEDGPIPRRYKLRETRSSTYRVRTEKNVIDSDGTLILHRGPLTGGTEFTRRLALKHGKPYLTVDLDADIPVDDVRHWLIDWHVAVLNVAGPRGSSWPDIHDLARTYLCAVFQDTSPTD